MSYLIVPRQNNQFGFLPEGQPESWGRWTANNEEIYVLWINMMYKSSFPKSWTISDLRFLSKNIFEFLCSGYWDFLKEFDLIPVGIIHDNTWQIKAPAFSAQVGIIFVANKNDHAPLGVKSEDDIRKMFAKDVSPIIEAEIITLGWYFYNDEESTKTIRSFWKQQPPLWDRRIGESKMGGPTKTWDEFKGIWQSIPGSDGFLGDPEGLTPTPIPGIPAITPPPGTQPSHKQWTYLTRGGNIHGASNNWTKEQAIAYCYGPSIKCVEQQGTCVADDITRQVSCPLTSPSSPKAPTSPFPSLPQILPKKDSDIFLWALILGIAAIGTWYYLNQKDQDKKLLPEKSK